eukprot:771078-Rhodomonas_salina.1
MISESTRRRGGGPGLRLPVSRLSDSGGRHAGPGHAGPGHAGGHSPEFETLQVQVDTNGSEPPASERRRSGQGTRPVTPAGRRTCTTSTSTSSSRAGSLTRRAGPRPLPGGSRARARGGDSEALNFKFKFASELEF